MSCLLLSSLAIMGCGGDNAYELHVAKGRVLYKGKPAGGAELTLFGTDDLLKRPEAPLPQAVADEDGYFNVHCGELGEGAPAGNYVVTVVWRQSESADPEVQDASRDRLRGKYADAARSPLRIEISVGANELPDIELK